MKRFVFILFLVALFSYALATSFNRSFKEIYSYRGEILDICYSESGSYLAVAAENQILLFGSDDYEITGILTGHEGLITSLDFIDEYHLFSASVEGVIIEWDIQNKQKMMQIDAGQSSPVTQVRYISHSEKVALGTKEGILQIYNLNTKQLVEEVNAHAGIISSLLYNPQLAQVISAGEDGIIRIWRADDLSLVKALTAHKDYVRDMKLNHDGSILYSCGDDRQILAWDLTNKTITLPVLYIKARHKNWITNIALQEEGNFMISSAHDQQIQLQLVNHHLEQNMTQFKQQKLISREKVFRHHLNSYISDLEIKPGTFELVIARNYDGLYVLKYYDEIFRKANSLLRE